MTANLEKAPDYAEPLVAWRIWHVIETRLGMRLHSTTESVVWPVGEALSAGCRRRGIRLPWRASQPHSPPSAGCSCGIYATHTPALARLRGLDAHTRRWRIVQRVVGRVRLWGSVVECDHGWRAAHAYPAEIFLSTTPSGTRKVLEPDRIARDLAAYMVPVHLLHDGVALCTYEQ